MTKLMIVAVSMAIISCGSPDGNNNDTQQAQMNGNNGPDYDQKVEDLGVELNTASSVNEHFVPAVKTGNLVFLSGHGPLQPDGTYLEGVVGDDLTIEEGNEAARVTMISLLSSLKEELGTLNKVERIVKVHGMVNCVTDFTEQPAVINGSTALLTDIFGDKGKPARAAVGMGSLPGNIPVEIEMVVQVSEN